MVWMIKNSSLRSEGKAIKNKKDTALTRCLLIILPIINFNYFLVISIVEVEDCPSETAVTSIITFP